MPLYIGLDVTSAVIEVNKQRFGHHNNKHFYFWDATECTLPKYQNENSVEQMSVDLVHVRDVVQHLSLERGVKYFCNVFKSGAKVLITTTYAQATSNRNIKEGDFYENNLKLEPFSFPNGDCIETHPSHEKDLTCVYNLTEPWVQEYMSTKC